MKTVIVIILGLLNAAAWWVAYQNRESEKVLSAFASISVSAFCAVLLAVFVFAEQPKIKAMFPVTFFVDHETGKPVMVLPRDESIYCRMSYGGIDSLQSSNPGRFSQEQLGNTYHQILQRLIIDWITQVYRAGWQVERRSYDLPAGGMFTISPAEERSSEGATKVDANGIAKLFPPGCLGRTPLMARVGGADATLMLPPESTMKIVVPHKDDRLGEVSVITIKNRYSTTEIKLIYKGITGGIGEYAVLGGYDNLLADKIFAVTYELKFETSFPDWLSGSPMIASRRAWAESMLRMLQEDFDEQAILQRSRENKHNPKLPPGGFMTESAVREYELQHKSLQKRPGAKPDQK